MPRSGQIRYGRNGTVTTLNDSIDAGSTLFLDSAPVIEHHPVYFALLEPVFGDLTIAPSPITLAEWVLSI
jgi:hypothetical protein